MNSITNADFTIVEAMLIDKIQLQNEIKNYGYDKSYLLDYARRIRESKGNSNSQYIQRINSSFKFMYSGQLAEKPINIVIQKSLLKKIARSTYLISEDGFAKIQ